QHSIEKAVILSDEKLLEPDSFSFRYVIRPIQDTANLSLEEMESAMISKALDRSNGNISAAAEQLGISRQTLYNKIRKIEQQVSRLSESGQRNSGIRSNEE
ncbi:MAG: helix-turn-helix domain-containing protein, partial [Bacteroidales bacterium]|nr:helix-turn-helix domain-containing protein [Bacteroidales bacterium]